MKVFRQKPSAGFLITIVLVMLLWLSVYLPNIMPARVTNSKLWQPPSTESNR